MSRLYRLLTISIVLALSACASNPPGSGAPGASTAIVGTASGFTISAGTVEPFSLTALPPGYTPPPTQVPPTLTPIPTLPGGLGEAELKYRILAQFPDIFFCDPDYYPVARADEGDLALQVFPDLQANPEEFKAILAHNNLSGLSTFTDGQKLLVYREHKKLAAIPFTLTGGKYQFQIQVAKTEGSGELVSGFIDGQGKITIQQRTPSFASCPICLAVGTLIATPTGEIPVQSLRVGMQVWTMDRSGLRVAMPVLRVSKTVVPATHQVVHLVLEDGRQVWASAGHPTADGRSAGQLMVGDWLDGARLSSVKRIRYIGAATYDLLPAGDTGFYWANGILLASTLKNN